MTVKFLCRLPAIPGNDLLHTTRTSAERELRNARLAGLAEGAELVEVLCRKK